jgi:hypothetical protein
MRAQLLAGFVCWRWRRNHLGTQGASADSELGRKLAEARIAVEAT